MTQQLCDALSYLQKLHITHGDIKPENMLLATPAEDAPLKLADFGLAAALLGPTTHAASALVGTPDYMAPELLLQKEHAYAPAVDHWAAGVVLYVLLSGTTPFGGTGQVRALRGTEAWDPPLSPTLTSRRMMTWHPMMTRGTL